MGRHNSVRDFLQYFQTCTKGDDRMSLIEKLGATTLETAQSLGEVWKMVRQSLSVIFHGKWEPALTLEQMDEIGVASFPVVGLTSLFTGMVLAFQSGFSFMKVFNEPIYVGSVVGL